MGAIVQNYSISQGATLLSQLTVQLPGIPITDTSGGTVLGSTNVTVGSTSAYAIGQSISGPNIPANTIITAVVDSGDLTISQPATATGTGLSLVIGAFNAVNLTGVNFLFSAKTAPPLASQSQAFSLPDSYTPAQGVVEFNWTETSTPLLGKTSLNVLDTITQVMPVGTWWYLIRMMGAPGFAASTDFQTGVINVTQPVSSRIS